MTDSSLASSQRPLLGPFGQVRELCALALWVILCFCAPLSGIWFRPGAWYAALVKPEWNPPAWVFGPVWTVLYISMAVAAWLVWRRGGLRKQWRPLLVFCLQLCLNALWTPLFFGFHLIAWALVDIVLLWLGLCWLLSLTAKVSSTAFWLLVPYLVWVTFASVLNFSLFLLN